jgi:hypothetical protein
MLAGGVVAVESAEAERMGAPTAIAAGRVMAVLRKFRREVDVSMVVVAGWRLYR